nr:hypothetical protein [Paenibacillus elgii]
MNRDFMENRPICKTLLKASRKIPDMESITGRQDSVMASERILLNFPICIGKVRPYCSRATSLL